MTEHERRMEFARIEVMKAYATEETKNTEVDPVLSEKLAEIFVVHMYEPHLGCATTGDMLDEIRARVDTEYTTMVTEG